MKKTIFTALLLASAMAAAPATAQTTTLTFDSLGGTNSVYGSGANGALPANVTGNGQFVAYTLGGYEVRLNTLNATNTNFGAHISDGYNGGSATFNWHDQGDNGVGASVTVSRVGGGLFNLTSFDYFTNSALTVTGGLLPVVLTGVGSSGGFSNVSSVTFSSINNASNGLDNLVLSAASGAVPEPATWGLMLVGFGAVGFAMRRRGQVRTAVKFA